MKFKCEKCNHQFEVQGKNIADEGVVISCPQCEYSFYSYGEDDGQDDLGDSESGAFFMAPEETPQDQDKDLDFDLELDLLDQKGKEKPPTSTPLTNQEDDDVTKIASTEKISTNATSLEEAIFDESFKLELEEDDDIGAGHLDHQPSPQHDRNETVTRVLTQENYYVLTNLNQKTGPINSLQIARLLSEGEFDGKESISEDGENWEPIDSIPQFNEIIKELRPKEDKNDQDLLTKVVPVINQDPAEMVQKPDDEKTRMVETEDSEQKIRLSKQAVEKLGTAQSISVKLSALGTKKTIMAAALLIVLITGVVVLSLFVSGGNVNLKSLSQSQLEKKPGYNFFKMDTYFGYMKAAQVFKKHFQKDSEDVAAQILLIQTNNYLSKIYGMSSILLSKNQTLIENIPQEAKRHPEFLVAKAGILIAKNKYPQAQGLLTKLLTTHPEHYESVYLLAYVLNIQKNEKAMTRYLNKLIDQGKLLNKAYHLMGLFKLGNKDFKNAQLYFQKSLQHNPIHLQSALELAIGNYLQKNYPDADKYLTMALGENHYHLSSTQQAKANYYKAKIYLKKKNFLATVSALQTAVKLNPSKSAYFLMLGNLHYQNQEYKKAKTTFETGLKLTPGSADLLIGYARAQMMDGKVVDAALKLADAIKKQPENAKLIYYMGKTKEKMKKNSEAEKHYNQAMELDEKYLEPIVDKAILLVRKGEFQQAVTHIEKAEAINPKSTIITRGRGEIFLMNKNYKKALKAFSEVLKREPDSVRAHQDMARCLMEAGRLDQAIYLFKKCLKMVVQPYQIYFNLGHAYDKKANYQQAVNYYQKSLKYDPSNIDLIIALGSAYYKSNKYKLSQKMMLKATEFSGERDLPYYYLGLIYTNDKKYDTAINMLRNAVLLKKENSEYYYRLGLAYKLNGSYIEAIEAFQSSMENNKNNWQAAFEWGEVLLTQDDYKSARQKYQEVLKLRPKHSKILARIGDCYFKEGNSARALTFYQKAYKINSRQKNILFQIGRSFDEIGKQNKAIIYYLNALKKEPKNALIHYYLGYAYKSADNYKQAIKSLQRYLKLDPDSSYRSELERELKILKNM